MWITVQAQMLLYADKWLDYNRTIHLALKLLKNERWLFKTCKLLWSFICQLWLTVQAQMLLYANKWLDYTRNIHIQAQMLLYADKWLDYTRTIHTALKMLKNERWLFKDNKLL